MKTSDLMLFLGGAVAGAAIALLFAPAKGEDTRHRIKEFVEDEINKRKHKCGCGCEDEVANLDANLGE